MNNLKAKLKKQGGFTLIEMLIVVAIIAILIAVSIPLVNSSLERARESTDAANERSFKAALLISYTVGEFDTTTGTDTFAPGDVYAYNAADGVITTTAPTEAYGKSTEVTGADGTDRTEFVLYGLVATDGTLKMVWADAGTIPQATAVDNSNLIAPELVANP